MKIGHSPSVRISPLYAKHATVSRCAQRQCAARPIADGMESNQMLASSETNLNGGLLCFHWRATSVGY
jgi:hypothetical protein